MVLSFNQIAKTATGKVDLEPPFDLEFSKSEGSHFLNIPYFFPEGQNPRSGPYMEKILLRSYDFTAATTDNIKGQVKMETIEWACG